MIESIVSEIGSIKELLDKETIPEFFDREFSFLAMSPALLYLADSDRIVHVNGLFTQELGYTASDLAQQSYLLKKLFIPVTDIETLKRLPREIQADEYAMPALNLVKMKDGRELHCRMLSKLLYRDCYVMQLTIVHDYENNFSKALFDQQTEKLNLANKELEEFAYIASHDLQEPLRKITTFIQRLQQKLTDTGDEDVDLYIQRIQVSAGNMRTLIDNLLEFSRAGRNKDAMEQVDLNVVIAEIAADTSLPLAASGAVVNTETLAVIEAVPSQMIQLFQHVFSNAVKFSKKEVALVVTVTGKELTNEEKQQYQLPVDNGYDMITITDNGIGFDPLYAEKIFQLFQRLHGKHEYPGTGLGLSICKKIVAAHGGLMFANSVPGEGSSFYIILPKHLSKHV